METETDIPEDVTPADSTPRQDINSTAPADKSDEEVILEYLKENGSPKVQSRMSVENGESFCISYIMSNITDGTTVPVALGWLEQELETWSL